jgi:hypothetical protein
LDALSYEILTGMYEWRFQHPDATLTEIEQALDERSFACVRVCSKIWHLSAKLPTGNPKPPPVRAVPTVGERSFAAAANRANSRPTATTSSPSLALMAIAQPVRKAIFPLDKQLALLAGRLTPLLQEQLTRLGTWMPFAKAAALLASFTHTKVSESSAQRQTESVGLAYEAVQLAEVEHIEQEWPDVAAGPDKLVLSVDGAFVPVLHGEWAEVKTLVVGEVGEATLVEGQPLVPTHSQTYFSRVAEAEEFQRLTFAELYRRRVEAVDHVAVVSDGAEWIQGYIDFHVPSAKRILDFPHAAHRICQIGEVVLGADHASLRAWQTRQLHQLKHHGPAGVLESLRSFAAARLSIGVVAENLAYLDKRVAQMQYPRFLSEGWPIGSGMVESANKLVVEARLKGAGMHWSRMSVNPLLALRNAVCNDRWAEAWQQSTAHIRRYGLTRRPVERKQKSAAVPTEAVCAPAPAAVEPQADDLITERKPAADHPWRRTYQATKARVQEEQRKARL